MTKRLSIYQLTGCAIYNINANTLPHHTIANLDYQSVNDNGLEFASIEQEDKTL